MSFEPDRPKLKVAGGNDSLTRNLQVLTFSASELPLEKVRFAFLLRQLASELSWRWWLDVAINILVVTLSPGEDGCPEC